MHDLPQGVMKTIQPVFEEVAFRKFRKIHFIVEAAPFALCLTTCVDFAFVEKSIIFFFLFC